MRVPRNVQISKNRAQCFHVISRVVDRRIIMEDNENEYLLRLIRKHEAFTGLEVLSYCLMGNHFHLLIHLPVKPDEISDEEVRRRMKNIYSKKKIAQMDIMIERHKNFGNIRYEKELYDQLRQRMYNLSSFVRDIKQKFSSWYNRKLDRKGTLWEERFKSVSIEGRENALMRTAAYIELNPIRAGMVRDPSEYRWSSYAEAIAGGKKARKGIMQLCAGRTGINEWQEALHRYRVYLYEVGGEQREGKKSFTPEEVMAERERKGVLSVKKALKMKIRYFSEGLAIGSADYLKEYFEHRHQWLGKKRGKVAHSMSGTGIRDLHSFRNAGG